MNADYATPVDLARDPLVNMTILQVGDRHNLCTAGFTTSPSTVTRR